MSKGKYKDYRSPNIWVVYLLAQLLFRDFYQSVCE